MAVRRVGDWDVARRALAGGGRRLGRALRQAVQIEAQRLRAEIVVGLRTQAPGGQPFRPLSALTLASRRLRGRDASGRFTGGGFRGQKALIRTGELRNSIAVIQRGDVAFVGVPKAVGPARLRIAEVHEFGSDPIIIPITPKMRRFLAVLFKRAGRSRPTGSRGGSGVVVTQIPARPFLRPVFEQWKKGVDRRTIATIRKRMGW